MVSIYVHFLFPIMPGEIEPMLGKCRISVVDGGPTFSQHWDNVTCYLVAAALRICQDVVVFPASIYLPNVSTVERGASRACRSEALSVLNSDLVTLLAF